MCRENGYQHLYLSFSLSFASISLSVVPLPLFAFCHATNIVDLAIWIFGLIFVGFFFFWLLLLLLLVVVVIWVDLILSFLGWWFGLVLVELSFGDVWLILVVIGGDGLAFFAVVVGCGGGGWLVVNGGGRLWMVARFCILFLTLVSFF